MSHRTIRIHLGAHKTASTYIQETLALNRDASAAAGVDSLRRESFRPIVSEIIRRRKAFERSRFARVKARLASLSVNDPITRISGAFAVNYDVTISEENLLGEAQDCFGGALYPHAPTYLGSLKAALPDRPLEILIALRSYDGFTSSLFAEALKNGALIGLHKARAVHARLPGEWPRLLTMIRDLFPEARITVWRYEDFASLEDELLMRMSGLEAASIAKPSQADILPSPSAEAIERFIEEAPALPMTDRRIFMRALRVKHPRSASSKRFTLWSDDEAAVLSQAYAHDVDAIKDRGDVEFLV